MECLGKRGFVGETKRSGVDREVNAHIVVVPIDSGRSAEVPGISLICARSAVLSIPFYTWRKLAESPLSHFNA